MRLGVLVAVCGAFPGMAVGALAQNTAAPPAATFTAGVELVRLDVRVTDRDGRPVRDLRQDEIDIVEEGERRPIVFFRHVEEPSEPLSDVVRHTVAGEVSTNQGAARGHLYVLVFDQSHITLGNEQRVRLAAQRFLKTRIRPGDRVAAYTLPGPGPQIAFTSNAARVASEIERVRGQARVFDAASPDSMRVEEAFQISRGDEEVVQQVSDRLQNQLAPTDIRRAESRTADFFAATTVIQGDAAAIVRRTDTETRRVLALLSDIMRQMRTVEGRKTVLLLSEGFYPDHVAAELEDVAAAAAQSYSVIYALDLNRRAGDAADSEPSGATAGSGVLDKIDPLGSLAVETGGLLITDAGSHAEEVFAALGEESQDYYLVGFEPRQGAKGSSNAYHRVRVAVRRDGVRTSTRSGFTLTDPSARLDRRQAIDRALAAPFPLQSLPVEYTTYVLRGSAGAQRIVLSLTAELPVASSQQTHPADVVFAVRSTRDGRVVAGGTDVIALPERRAGSGSTGVGTFRVQFELPAGEYMMRAVVREPGGLVGSADRRFVVRALDGPSVAAGDLVLSGRRGELPVRPTVYAGDALSGILELYARTADRLDDARVNFELSAVGEASPLVTSAADIEAPRDIDGGVARAARLDLPLDGLAPGAYVARATVMVGRETIADVLREVEIRPGPRPAAREEPAAAAAFDPHELVKGALAQAFGARLARTTWPGKADALRGLERLDAADYPDAIGAFQASLAAEAEKSADATTLSAATAFFLGWAYHAAQDDRDAISAWRRAAFEDPTLVSAHLALADAFERLSQPALAVQAVKAGLAALPASRELLDRLRRLHE
jgi:VWFA-related protein